MKYYPPDFKVSDRGVFARKPDDNGHPDWDKICTTRRINLEALRDVREEAGHLYRPHQPRREKKKLAVPHALIHADKVADIAGQGLLRSARRNPSTRPARQLLVQFLALSGKRAHNCRASDRLALQRWHLAIRAPRRNHRACWL